MRPSSALSSRERSQLPDRKREQQRGDDQAEQEGAGLAAERHEQDQQCRDRHALDVRLAGHPPAEQALSEQVQRGPAEDNGRANAARVSTPRTAEEDAGSNQLAIHVA